MQSKKVRHIFIFFLLFDAILMFISTVFRQKTVLFKFLANKTRSIKQNIKNDAAFYVLNSGDYVKSNQNSLQLVAVMDAPEIATATNYYNTLIGFGQHQPRLTFITQPKLMLFPYHTYW